MSDNANNQSGQQSTAQQQTQQPDTTPQAAASQTPQQQGAANNAQSAVDMAAIEKAAQERAERAAATVVKDMLKQQGLDDEAIKTMLKEYKDKQVTPEQALKALEKEKEVGFAERDRKIAEYERRDILRGHGLTDAEDIEVMSIRIERLMTKEKDFATAAKEYFEKNPRPDKPPATAVPGVSGNTPLTATEQEQLNAQYKQAIKNRDSGLMAKLISVAQSKGITLKE